jgi:hypothetical protein
MAVFLGALFVARAALAEPTAAEKETARGHMAEGRSRRAESDLRGALASFLAADAIMHVPTTAFEVARTQASIGQLVEARETIRRILRLPAHADDPAPFAEARANAERLDGEIASRIPSIRIELRGGAPSHRVTMELDGIPIPSAALAEPLQTNPGHHVVVARDGDATARSETDVAEGQHRVLVIAAPDPATPPAIAPRPAPVRSAPAAKSTPLPARSPLVYLGFSLAAAGASIGTVGGILSLGATSRARDRCEDTRCSPLATDDLDTARTTATIANIGFTVAGAGLVVGLGALLLDGSAPSKPAATLRVEPWFGAASGGVRGTF